MNILQYESLQEQKSHGREDFPYTTYICSIPQDFVQVPMHWHEEMELIYIKKGCGIVSVDMQSHIVDAGTIVMILPGQLHGIYQLETNRMEYENIIFQPGILFSRQTDVGSSRFLQPFFSKDLAIPTVFTAGMDAYPALSACLDQADEICKSFPQAYSFAIKSQLFQFFFLLFNHYGTDKKNASGDHSLERIKHIVKYVEENYIHPIHIAEIAAELGMSSSHFMKFFRETMGTSFISYLNEYRLTMASRLLLSSTDSVLSIAGETGFDNLSNFNRLFKRQFGMSPRAYRRREG